MYIASIAVTLFAAGYFFSNKTVEQTVVQLTHADFNLIIFGAVIVFWVASLGFFFGGKKEKGINLKFWKKGVKNN